MNTVVSNPACVVPQVQGPDGGVFSRTTRLCAVQVPFSHGQSLMFVFATSAANSDLGNDHAFPLQRTRACDPIIAFSRPAVVGIGFVISNAESPSLSARTAREPALSLSRPASCFCCTMERYELDRQFASLAVQGPRCADQGQFD